jgi:DNA-directed RNA polymerase subunit E'/Rpb7
MTDLAVSPYRIVKVTTILKLRPSHMNSDIYNNAKAILKQEVIGYCDEHGCVVEIYDQQILHAEFIAEDLSGDATVSVRYAAKSCFPQKGTNIIAEIYKINKAMILARNGPCVIVIQIHQFNKNSFNVNDDGDVIFRTTGKPLAAGDQVKVRVTNVKLKTGDRQIITLAELLDVASASERDLYHHDLVVDKADFVDPSEVNGDIMRDDDALMQVIPPTSQPEASDKDKDKDDEQKENDVNADES